MKQLTVIMTLAIVCAVALPAFSAGEKTQSSPSKITARKEARTQHKQTSTVRKLNGPAAAIKKIK